MREQRWQVRSIDLSEPLEPLYSPEGYDGIRPVFFFGELPLGHCLIMRSELPMTAEQLAVVASRAVAQTAGSYTMPDGFASAVPGLPLPDLEDPERTLAHLAALTQPLERLAARVEQEASPLPTLTVAIPTRERPRDLERCLRALADSHEPAEEILVIDNRPVTGATAEVVRRFPHVRYHREDAPGLSAARNAALAEARGDVVAFADDDVQVHPRWMKIIRRSFVDPKITLVTGLVLPGELETPAQFLFEEDLQFFYQGYRPRRFDAAYFSKLRRKGVPVWTIGAGANMAVRRSVYQAGHRFDTRLGPGVFGGCGEDSEFWYGILAAGGECLYEPRACVFHYHRRELSDLRRLMHEYMKGHVASLILQFVKYGDVGNLRRLLFYLPAEYALMLPRLIASGFAMNYRLLLKGGLGSLSGLRFTVQAFRGLSAK